MRSRITTKWTWIWASVVVLLGALTVVGQSAETRCEAAMREAADEPDDAAAEPLILGTLLACPSAADWLDALKRYPAAMGFRTRNDVNPAALWAACYASSGTPVCRDAAEHGMLPTR